MATAATTAVGGTIAHEHALKWIVTGSADPSAGAGVEAAIATLYVRNTGTAGSLWLKTGPDAIAWTEIALAV